MDEKSVIRNSSKKLQDLFDKYSKSTENETDTQFQTCNKNLLSALHVDEFLNKIQSLKENVEIRRENPSENQQMALGAVYAYDVHMVCGKNGLPILEKGPEEGFFRNEQLPKAATVIWIHSKAVRVIDAKLCAYKKYGLDTHKEKRILLHHAFDEHDEIFKLSALHILDSLDDIISAIKSRTELKIPPSVLQNAAETTWKKENMRQFSMEADLYDDSNHVGTCTSKSYKCIWPSTVNRIKDTLSEKILVQAVGLLLENVFEEVANCIGREGEHVLKKYFPNLKLHYNFTNMFKLTKAELEQWTSIPLLGQIIGTLEFIKNVFWRVDVNSLNWRNSVADDAYTFLWERKTSVFSYVLNECLRNMLTRLRKDLDSLLKQSDDYKKKIDLSDQHTMIDEWMARKSIEKSHIPSSIVTYVSGRKYGVHVPIIKVFLSHEDTKAKEFVNKMWGTSIRPEFVTLSRKFKENSRSPIKKMEQTAPSMHVENMYRIIDRQSEKLMAYHSTIVAIGVDRNQSGFPCIVLYCLDKMLIPFGEKKIPEFIEDERVEIREI